MRSRKIKHYSHEGGPFLDKLHAECIKNDRGDHARLANAIWLRIESNPGRTSYQKRRQKYMAKKGVAPVGKK